MPLASHASEQELLANEFPEMNRVTLLKKNDAHVTINIASPLEFFPRQKL
tara:strand:- start:59 stop:208 length:150 start_codon:yes stop_codon:yes gene_type:complete